MNINNCSNAYKNHLRSDYFQTVRIKVFERDNYTCRVCGSKEQKGMTAHHFSGASRFHELDDLDMVVCLCDRCHTKYHLFMKRRDFLGENQGQPINPLIKAEFEKYITDNQDFINLYFEKCSPKNIQKRNNK